LVRTRARHRLQTPRHPPDEARHRAEVERQHRPFGDVRILRDGTQLTTGPSAGTYTDNIRGKGTGSFTYKVCETGGSRCSNDVTVVF